MAPALLLPYSRPVGAAFWIALVVVCVSVDVVARHTGGRLATAGEFVRLISRPPLANFLLVGAWTYAGWHFFAH
jgi:hypothetical protein